MLQMLCRNRVADFDKWWRVFMANNAAAKGAGLHLQRVWRCENEPNNVYFLFDVADAEGARRFVDAPEAAQAGEDSGVIDGEWHFVTLHDHSA